MCFLWKNVEHHDLTHIACPYSKPLPSSKYSFFKKLILLECTSTVADNWCFLCNLCKPGCLCSGYHVFCKRAATPTPPKEKSNQIPQIKIFSQKHQSRILFITSCSTQIHSSQLCLPFTILLFPCLMWSFKDSVTKIL